MQSEEELLLDGTAKGDTDYVWLAGSIVASYVRNNSVPTHALAALIEDTYSALERLKSNGSPSVAGEAPKTLQRANQFGPAVPVDKSVTREYLVCLEDGKRLKMLKRHLRTKYGLTLEQYRAKWGLPPDYPVVAPAYAVARSNIAKAKGLGKWSRTAKRGRVRLKPARTR